MIHFVTGNILDSSAQALVNTVNTMGVMGKGIALQFKKQFPNNYRIYKEVCEQNALQVGQLLIIEEDSMFSGKKVIINFPTKTNWRLPSEYEYIEAGLKELKKVVLERNIESIAIPPLGAGNGGLEWQKVKKMIIDTLSDLDCETYLYEPTAAIKEVFFVRAGITNFQKALSDGDTLNQKKVWIYQPSLGAGFKINNVMLDYAFSNLANQSNPLFTHVFSLRINFVKKED